MSNFHNCPECGSNKTNCIGPGDYIMNPRIRGDYKRTMGYYCNDCKKYFVEQPIFN